MASAKKDLGAQKAVSTPCPSLRALIVLRPSPRLGFPGWTYTSGRGARAALTMERTEFFKGALMMGVNFHMSAFSKSLILGAASLGLAACGSGEESEGTPDAPAIEERAPTHGEMLDAVLAGDHRSAEERARDTWRNPKETLLFFGIDPDMTIVEVSPGGGWYTQVLAPYLAKGDGVLYAATYNREGANERVLASLDAFRATYVEQPEIYGEVIMTAMTGDAPIAPDGSADAVLTFRNVHNWQSRGTAGEMFAKFYAALKPGGVLGVVEHRADGADVAEDGSSGYVYTDDVIELARDAGFDFDMKSEINANPADTRDHPFGVWTLAPVRRTAAIRGAEDPDFDRSAYDAIGESDRMTLKFRKPVAADGALLE